MAEAETESNKTKQKPGVRTNLNSGEKKVKANLTKAIIEVNSTPVNPTAEAAAKSLPSMKLTTNTNWAEETSSSVLNAVTPVSSERSLGDNKVVPVKNSEPLIPVEKEETPVKQEKKSAKSKKKEKIKEPKVAKEPKNKYKEKVKESKDKNGGGLLKDLKASITQGIDSIKIDYDQLAHIQAELHTSAGDIKTSLGDRVNRIKDYANSAMANTANTVKNIEMPKFKKDETDVNYDIPKEEKPKPQPKAKETPKPQSTKPEAEQPKPQEKVNATTVTTEELKAAAEVSSESAKPKDDKELTQKLNQAIQRRDGAKNALNALNTQLQYTPKDQQKALKDRIKQKENQLADAEKLVSEIQQQLAQ